MPKKKRKKIGRRLAYETPAKLSKAVANYFDGICYELPCTDEHGAEICDLNGEPIVLIKYIVPPSIQDLCLHLSIDTTTWENYSRREGYAEICHDAKLKVEAYLTSELNIRDRPQGIMFNLENNFDWKRKKEVDLGEDTRKAMQLASMTIEEKQKLLAEACPELAAYVAAGEPEEYTDEDEDE